MNESLPLMALAGAAVLATAYVVFTFRVRSPEDTVGIAFLRSFCLLYCGTIHRLRVRGKGGDPLPDRGAFIVASNHRSGVDPVVLSIATRRRLHFLMAREYYETPVLHRLCRALGCIPVNRDGIDLGATKAAMKHLRAGRVIAIFPQGGIRSADEPMQGKEGAALLALRTGTPVVPVYLEGSPNISSVFLGLLKPSRTIVTFGEPLVFREDREGKPSREKIASAAREILEAIARLSKQEQKRDRPLPSR